MDRKTVLLAVVLSGAMLGLLALPAFSKQSGVKPIGWHFRTEFVAHLSGRTWVSIVDSSVTYTIDTRAQGQAIFHTDEDMTEITFMLVASNIENITMAHIHLDTGVALGPIVVWLYPRTPPPREIPGRFDGVLAKGRITDADLVGPLQGMTVANLVGKMRTGEAYVVVHTTQNPPGEIRGFIH
jgi:hypothetical protein